MCHALRNQRSLTQKGFELSNGLPFVPTDYAMHELLKSHAIAEAQALQVALGKIRRASGHFQGRLLGIDPFLARPSGAAQICTQIFCTTFRFFSRDSSI